MLAFLGFSINAFAQSPSGSFCCIQSTLDNQNGINHAGQSNYCVNNNFEEMTEVKSNIFTITKYGYTFKIDLNVDREDSIAITKPDGSIQTKPEREVLKGLMKDLFIGTFGYPRYQYFSESAASLWIVRKSSSLFSQKQYWCIVTNLSALKH